MNRKDFQELARLRLEEAESLLQQGHYSGAYYLCGYTVECGLKACIARLTTVSEAIKKNLGGVAMRLNVVTNDWLKQGWELILALDAERFPLKAAFWSPVGENDVWRLFIASRLVEEEGPLIAYDHIDSALHKLTPQPGPSIYKLSLSDTSALGLESRLFKELKSRVPEAVRKTAKKLNADFGDLLTWDDKLVYKLG